MEAAKATPADVSTAEDERIAAAQAAARLRNRRGDHKPKKTAMLLAQRIVAEISDRDLPPGTALLSEREMLERYGVARGTLREALRFLEIHGVVSIRTGPGGGPVVSEPASRHLGSVMAMMLHLEGAPFRAVLEARLTLEPALASKAARRGTEPLIAELRESVRRMRERLDDEEFFLHENEVFHHLVAVAADNQFLSLVISSLNWISDGTPLGVDYSMQERQAVLRSHRRIVQAIASGDGERAAAAMAGHIEDFEAYLDRRFPHVVEARLRWDQLG